MKSQQYYQTLSWFLILIMVLGAVCAVGGVALAIAKLTAEPDEPTPLPSEETDSAHLPTGADPIPGILGETDDRGMAYIDKMIFFGESTTSHLASRGVLSGGKDTDQVWSNSSNTRTLSSKTLSEVITTPQNVCGLTLAEACAQEKPEYMVFSFGLNGISEFFKNKDGFLANYKAIITAVKQASPDTKIIIQSVYPVTDGTTSPFGDIETTNRNVGILNNWLKELAAAEEDVCYCDTASVLTDSATNRLRSDYALEDGVHLTTEAYQRILYYLRTHAWE